MCRPRVPAPCDAGVPGGDGQYHHGGGHHLQAALGVRPRVPRRHPPPFHHRDHSGGRAGRLGRDQPGRLERRAAAASAAAEELCGKWKNHSGGNDEGAASPGEREHPSAVKVLKRITRERSYSKGWQVYSACSRLTVIFSLHCYHCHTYAVQSKHQHSFQLESAKIYTKGGFQGWQAEVLLYWRREWGASSLPALELLPLNPPSPPPPSCLLFKSFISYFHIGLWVSLWDVGVAYGLGQRFFY